MNVTFFPLEADQYKKYVLLLNGTILCLGNRDYSVKDGNDFDGTFPCTMVGWYDCERNYLANVVVATSDFVLDLVTLSLAIRESFISDVRYVQEVSNSMDVPSIDALSMINFRALLNSYYKCMNAWRKEHNIKEDD